MNNALPSVTARSVFTHEIVVKNADIDRLGHTSNVVVLQWIQDVAEAHSASVGFPYAAYERMGSAFVVRRHEIEYLRPSVCNERLSVRTWVESARSASCSRGTEITSLSNDGHMVARAMTTWVFAKLETLKLLRIPDDVRLAFGFLGRGEKTTCNTNLR